MTLAARLRQIVDALPAGAAVTLPTDAVRAWLEEELYPAAPVLSVEEPATWRERLWTVPSSTRLSVAEVAEAAGRSRDWCYRATDKRRALQKGREPLPCSRIDGMLVFTAGDVRAWLQRSEQLINPPRRGS
jgi:predicted DNA-binding transcriptional regulator AlpA